MYAAEGGGGYSPNAYAYCLNCTLLLFFCVQGGQGVGKKQYFLRTYYVYDPLEVQSKVQNPKMRDTKEV